MEETTGKSDENPRGSLSQNLNLTYSTMKGSPGKFFRNTKRQYLSWLKLSRKRSLSKKDRKLLTLPGSIFHESPDLWKSTTVYSALKMSQPQDGYCEMKGCKRVYKHYREKRKPWHEKMATRNCPTMDHVTVCQKSRFIILWLKGE
jgi:hypothetical protein